MRRLFLIGQQHFHFIWAAVGPAPSCHMVGGGGRGLVVGRHSRHILLTVGQRILL